MPAVSDMAIHTKLRTENKMLKDEMTERQIRRKLWCDESEILVTQNDPLVDLGPSLKDEMTERQIRRT
jgi:hypothetical protein